MDVNTRGVQTTIFRKTTNFFVKVSPIEAFYEIINSVLVSSRLDLSFLCYFGPKCGIFFTISSG